MPFTSMYDFFNFQGGGLMSPTISQAIDTASVNVVAGMPPLATRLSRKKEQLEEELKAVNEALEMLKKFPEVQSVLNALSKIGY